MQTVFFRLLKTPIDEKGDALAAEIAALNATGQAEETYALDPADFSLIPGSPFAYWVGDAMRRLFKELPRLGEQVDVKQGLATADDFRFVRAWWEVAPETIGYSAGETRQGCGWSHCAKGGAFSPFYTDVHLVVDWENNGLHLRNFERAYIRNEDFYFRPGLTWPARPHKRGCFNILPEGCVFSHTGMGMFASADDELLILLAILNSQSYLCLLGFLQPRGTTSGSGQTLKYELGYVGATPLPSLSHLDEATRRQLAALGERGLHIQREADRTDETSHAFCLPGLVQHREAESLLQASLALESEAQAAQARLAAIQAEIDDLVFDLYGLSETDRALVRAEMGKPETSNLELETAEENDEDEITPPEDLPARVQNLLMWCVGVAFGRWDVRFALDPTLLPALQEPFDPLPRCAPGALVSTDGLPPANVDAIAPEAWLRTRQNVLDIPSLPHPHTPTLPIPLPWDSILVDDSTHPSDIVARVRSVLSLLWGDRAGAIEREACEILGVKGLRDYFRDARKGFFAFHVKRYSKSRRKAPIYWLLQSEKRNYGIWLYIHRLRPDALFVAGRDYADAKVALEEARLQELRAGLEALDGSARRRREREIERQQKLVVEVTEFRDRLDKIALLNLPPDLNDGVTISIAPLWELVPWKEAQRTWEKLVAREYAWSTMAQRMQERGLVQPEG